MCIIIGPPVMVQLDVSGDAVLRGLDYEVVEGETVVMNCSLLADSQPTVTWFLNGAEIDTSRHPEKYVVQNMYEDVPPIGRYVDTLVIHNVSPRDNGGYTCRAQNIHTDSQQPAEDTQVLAVLGE